MSICQTPRCQAPYSEVNILLSQQTEPGLITHVFIIENISSILHTIYSGASMSKYFH